MSQEELKDKKSPPLEMKDLVIAFISPMLIGKTFVMYFGLQYSCYPEQGYGYGLALSILFTVTMLIRFLWRYRHYSE